MCYFLKQIDCDIKKLKNKTKQAALSLSLINNEVSINGRKYQSDVYILADNIYTHFQVVIALSTKGYIQH